MRSSKKKKTFKAPFSQASKVNKSTPCCCLASRSKQISPAELSPLHIGKIQTVTPKTKRQILKRLAYNMKRQTMSSSGINSPAISFPYDSQPDLLSTDFTECEQQVEEVRKPASQGVNSPCLSFPHDRQHNLLSTTTDFTKESQQKVEEVKKPASPSVTTPCISFPDDSQLDPKAIVVTHLLLDEGRETVFQGVSYPDVISAVISPGISDPFESQTDSNDDNAECMKYVDEDGKMLEANDVSQEKLDLELSQRNNTVVKSNVTNSTSDITDLVTNIKPMNHKSASSIDSIENSVKLNGVSSDIATRCVSFQKSKKDYVDAISNEEIHSNILPTVDQKKTKRTKSKNLTTKTCNSTERTKLYDNPETGENKVDLRKKTKITFNKKGKESQIQNFKEDRSVSNIDSKKNTFVCKISQSGMTNQKQSSLSNSRKRKTSTNQRCKTKQQVKHDVLRAIKKMHTEIQQLLGQETTQPKGTVHGSLSNQYMTYFHTIPNQFSIS